MYFRDLAPLVLLWIAFTLLFSSMKIKKPFLYPILIVLVLLIVQNIYQSFVFDENIKLFNENKKLECSIDSDKYIVQKSKSVSIQKYYFVKDQRLMLVIDCKEF